LLIALLQAVLRAFAHALSKRRTTVDDDGEAHLKERFELFLNVMCDAIVGWDAVHGREAKHSRRFLRVSIRHFHADARALDDNDGKDAANSGSAALEASVVAPAAVSQTVLDRCNAGQSAGHDSSFNVRENVEMGFSAIAGKVHVAGDNLDAAATQTSCSTRSQMADYKEDESTSKALYLGVALEEQCACVWFGQRIPAVLSGMLTALSTPVDVMLDALSCATAFDDCTAAVVFAELESLCVGRAGDADVVCRAIVSKRSVHGAGLDIGLLRLWLRRLPDAVSCEYLNRCP